MSPTITTKNGTESSSKARMSMRISQKARRKLEAYWILHRQPMSAVVDRLIVENLPDVEPAVLHRMATNLSR